MKEQLDPARVARIDELRKKIGLIFNSRFLDDIEIYHKEYDDGFIEKLFLNNDGEWRLRNNTVKDFGSGAIVLKPHQIAYVFGGIFDETLIENRKRSWQRRIDVGVRMDKKADELGKRLEWYDKIEETLDKISDFYSKLYEEHLNAHTNIYLDELIRLLENVLKSFRSDQDF